MTLTMYDSTATPRVIKKLTIYDATATPHVIQQLSIYDDTATPRPIFASLTAAADPSSDSNSGSSPGTISVVVGPFSLTPTGGIAPYTYSWVITDSTGSWAIDTPTGANTTVTASFLTSGELVDATLQGTITDSIGSVAVSNTVNAEAFNTG